jgi:hypothetical protein
MPAWGEFRVEGCNDTDNDGYGDPGDPSCPRGPETDCDDDDEFIKPGATEICDGSDNNCDGNVDEGGVCPPAGYYIDITMPGNNYNEWLPTYDETTPVTVTVEASVGGLQAGDTVSPVTLTVTNITNYPGRYTNDTSTDATDDFDFSDLDTTDNQFSLTSLDYGGSITIHADATVTQADSTEVTVQKDFRVPKDTDNGGLGDGLPDFWESLYTGDINPTADTDTSVGSSSMGDGLTNLEEYRGFIWGPELIKILREDSYTPNPYKTDAFVSSGEDSPHFRSNPGRKDLFVKHYYYDVVKYDPSGLTTTTVWDNPNCKCPFAIGAAFANVYIDVHAYSLSRYDPAIGGDLAGNPLPGEQNIDVVLMDNERAVYGTQDGRTNKLPGVRLWDFDTKGFTSGGVVPRVYRNANTYWRSLNYYFQDNPYIDSNTWDGEAWYAALNGVLDPITSVEDLNDNGVLDAGDTELGIPNSVPDGDLVSTPISYGNTLTVMDIDDDGDVELPLALDPSTIDPDYEYTMPQVLKHTITHEMGHTVGIGIETTEANCVMYQNSIDWSRDGTFRETAQGLIDIHNWTLND